MSPHPDIYRISICSFGEGMITMEKIRPYGHAVQEYYVKRIREVQKKRREGLFSITTPGEARKQVKRSRKAVMKCFGPFPEKTPLNAHITGTLERDGYTVEKVIFESRPGYRVTGNCYIPSVGDGPFPAVLGTCGHAGNGKACEPYQLFCQGLVRKGWIVLTYDPVSQGERLQYLDYKDHPVAGGCCREHNMAGNQMCLAGEYIGMWRAWDGIRALDYLLSREEADPSRVGVTGNSGGGTMTAFLNALEDRFTMAAPSCFVSTYVRNIENEESQDSEQYPPHLFEFGCDMADFFIARAPRPVILLGQKNDFFDQRGTRETYEEAAHIYRLLGCEDNIKLFFGPRSHGFFQENREAMYAFFNTHADMDAGAEESEGAVEKDADLRCTSKGQVNSEGSKKVYAFTGEKAGRLSVSRIKPDQERLKRKAELLLCTGPDIPVPYWRILRPAAEEKGIVRNRFALETEGDMTAVLHRIEKESVYTVPENEAVDLYIPHIGSREDILSGEYTKGMEGGRIQLAIDVRGIGEMTPVACKMKDFFDFYDSDYMYASIGIMLGKPYLGGKVRDVLSACALLQSRGCSVHLRGRGLGAVVCAFASLVSDFPERVTLVNGILSYREIAQSAVYRWPLSSFLPCVLEYFDLPDIFNVLERRDLRIIDPWDENMEVRDRSTCRGYAEELGINPDCISCS